MTALGQIEDSTRQFAEARKALSAEVEELEAEIALLKKKHMPRIKRFVENAVEKKAKLHASIEEAPDFFKKPRTMILYGIKIGFQKGKGEITWEDKEQVVKLIHKHFPEQAEALLKVTEMPVKTALAQLSAADLKKLGVTIIETGDEIIIRATDTEVDRLVEALLKDETEIKEAA